MGKRHGEGGLVLQKEESMASMPHVKIHKIKMFQHNLIIILYIPTSG